MKVGIRIRFGYWAAGVTYRARRAGVAGPLVLLAALVLAFWVAFAAGMLLVVA